MAKLKRSNEHKEFSEINRLFEERQEALQHFFDCENVLKYIGYSQKDVDYYLSDHLREAEYDACLTLLGAIEAALRLDLDYRHRHRLKDQKSKEVRQMLKGISRGDFVYRIPITKIIDLLNSDQSVPNRIVNSLKNTFKYRHWLAHGRYWQLQIGIHKPSFLDIYQLAQTIEKMELLLG